MNFKWDDTKRKSNIKKRGIDFINAPMIFDSYTLTINDDRYDYGEERFITFGILEGRVVVVTHTENDDSIRIISIRKATKYEEKTYFSQIPD
ncbi:MAG: BrnT family toxin [Proteobacteria bacterium]|nr:BrnT family toxin [Pseudomonadota bacterium]